MDAASDQPDESTRDAGSESVGERTTTTETTVTDDRPPRRRSTAVGAVLAAVLLVMAVVAAVALTGDDDTPDQDRAAPAARLPVSLGAVPTAASGEAADAMLASVTHVAGPDLPALGGDAPTHRLDGDIAASQVETLAAALGLEGSPVAADPRGSWTVTDGSGYLQVSPGAGGSWWYGAAAATADAVPQPLPACTAPGPCDDMVIPPDCGPGADCVAPECGPLTNCVSPDVCDAESDCRPLPAPVDLPSEAEAREAALAVVVAAGGDPAGAAVTLDAASDAWHVSIELVVDDRPSGLMFHVAVGAEGQIVNASGPIAALISAGQVPTLDTRSALARHQSGTGEGPQVQTEEAFDDPAPDATIEPAPLPAPEPAPGPPVTGAPEPAPEPIEVVLTEVEEIFVLLPAIDGSADAYLVPGYRFRADDGTQLDVVSVADEAVSEPPPAPDTTVPGPDEPVAPPADEPLPGEIPPADPCKVAVEDDGTATTHTIACRPAPPSGPVPPSTPTTSPPVPPEAGSSPGSPGTPSGPSTSAPRTGSDDPRNLGG